MPTFDCTAIGEGGVRLSVPAGTRLERTEHVDVAIAGTEANVLCTLSSLGWATSWFSGLAADSPIARRVEFQLRSFGVDLSGVHRGEGRTGTYWAEYSVPPRATAVFFDRRDTAFSRLTVANIDWDKLLDTRLLHLTGLTAALSPTVLEVLQEAIRRADHAGVPVSFDVNYRNHLWTPEVAAPVLRPFIEQAEIVFCRGDDVRLILGGPDDIEGCLQRVSEVSNASCVVTSCGADGALALIDGQLRREPASPVTILDRLGAGDGLAAGFLHSWLLGDRTNALRYGTAVAGLALSQYGEQIITNRIELEAIVADPHISLRR